MAIDQEQTDIYLLLDKSVRFYKKYAADRFSVLGFDITIDQWSVLEYVFDNKHPTQIELSRAVFKDTASITRIIDLLHTKKLLRRLPNELDKRKSTLALTKKGVDCVTQGKSIVAEIKEVGLKGLSETELQAINSQLKQIVQNLG